MAVKKKRHSYHLLLTKAQFSGTQRSQASPQRPLFALASCAWRSRHHAPQHHPKPCSPPGWKRVPGRAPPPKPSLALVSFQHKQGLEHVLGVSAHGCTTLLTDQLLTSCFLPRWSKHNLGLFMGSSTVTFP